MSDAHQRFIVDGDGSDMDCDLSADDGTTHMRFNNEQQVLLFVSAYQTHAGGIR